MFHIMICSLLKYLNALMTSNTYLDLCTQVYDLSKPSPPKDAYAFYRHYALKANGLILEPMCGSGRFLIPFLEEGFNIHGFDNSQHMLNALQEKAKNKNLHPITWLGTIQALKQKVLYDLILIPAGSFGLITDPNDIMASLQALFVHLQSNGILLFEIETSKAVPLPQGVWRGSSWSLPASQDKIVSSYCSSIEKDICTAIARYELIDSGKIIRTEIEQYKIKLYDNMADLIELLHETGFRKINMHKAFVQQQKPDNNDATIVVECIK